MTSMTAALSDIKVVDLTSMIAGPTMGRLFAELGADVIHVEPPHGDDGRNSTTPFLGREGVIYSVSNRSKRGMVVNIKKPQGRDVLATLVKDADVFVENMTPGTLDELGLGYADLCAVNPRIVYVSISGWGTTGPLAQTPGYDVIIQAFSGAMRRPAEDQPPMLGAMVGDPTAPLIAAFATMVAVRARDATGRGTHITTSLLQGALHVMSTGMMVAEADTTPPSAAPRGLPGGAGVFQTSDGLYSVVCAWTDRQFQRLCHLAGFEHLAADPANGDRLGRQRAAQPLNEIFADWIGGMTRDRLLEILRGAEIPCAPVNSGLQDLLHDPHVLANQMVVPVEHPTKGRLWQVGTAFEFDGERGTIRPAPMLGQHTDEVLREHGFSADDIARLRAEGAVV